MMLAVTWAIVLFISAFGGALAGPPSFDCSKASSPIEKAICQDEVLGDMDRALSDLYKRFFARFADSEDQGTARAQQRGWIRQRDSCAQSSDVQSCLVREYGQRVSELESTLGELGQVELDPATKQALELLVASLGCARGAGRMGIDSQQTTVQLTYAYKGSADFFRVTTTEVAISSDRFGKYERRMSYTTGIPMTRIPLPPKKDGARLIFECQTKENCFYTENGSRHSFGRWAELVLCDAKTADNVVTAIKILASRGR